MTVRRAAVAPIPIAAGTIDPTASATASVGVRERAVEREIVRVAQQASRDKDMTVRNFIEKTRSDCSRHVQHFVPGASVHAGELTGP